MKVIKIFKICVFGHFLAFLAIFGLQWPYLSIFPTLNIGFQTFYYLSTDFGLMWLRIRKKTCLKTPCFSKITNTATFSISRDYTPGFFTTCQLISVCTSESTKKIGTRHTARRYLFLKFLIFLF